MSNVTWNSRTVSLAKVRPRFHHPSDERDGALVNRHKAIEDAAEDIVHALPLKHNP